MSNLTENVSKALIGKQVAFYRYTAEIFAFHFGEIITDDDGQWGEFSLHVQSPWRIVGNGEIITGYHDQKWIRKHWDEKKTMTLSGIFVADFFIDKHDIKVKLSNQLVIEILSVQCGGEIARVVDMTRYPSDHYLFEMQKDGITCRLSK